VIERVPNIVLRGVIYRKIFFIREGCLQGGVMDSERIAKKRFRCSFWN
jgi:hypothetical protein